MFIARSTHVLLALALAITPAAGPAAAADPAHGNAVTHWNAVATDAFTPSQGTNPMAQSRTLAILHAAIHDALNAIDCRFEPYTPDWPRHRVHRWKRQSPRRPVMCWSRCCPTRRRWSRRRIAVPLRRSPTDPPRPPVSPPVRRPPRRT